jgi:hypothetical protein
MPFQPGFFSARGTEIVFENLGSVIEVVRRAYVAGGGDSDSGPAPLDGEPNAPNDDGDGWSDESLLEWYERAARRAETERPAQPAPGSFRFVRPGLSKELARDFFLTHGGQGILKDVAEDVVLNILTIFAKRVTQATINERFRGSLFAWAQLMGRAGFLRHRRWLPVIQQIDPKLAGDLESALFYPWGPHHNWPQVPAPWQSTSPLLFHVPMPELKVRRSREERLIDALMLALSTPGPQRAKGSQLQWAVWLVGACTLMAQQPGSWSTWDDPLRRREAVLMNALSWLLCELPVPIAFAPDAESALAEYAAEVTLP